MESVIDALIIVILLAVLGLGSVLYLRIQQLRRGAAAIDRLSVDLLQACEKADGALHGLRRAAEEAHQRLGAEVKAAEALRGELRLIVGSADQAAERLTSRIEDARTITAKPPAPAAEARAATPAAVQTKASSGSAERRDLRDLERALSVLR